MIEIKHLYKRFGNIEVLKNLNLEISQSGVFAILGPNGSGKTTLIKSILGMVIPDYGEIYFNGSSVHKKWKYRKLINYLPQIANFPSNLTVGELIGMIKNLRGGTAEDQQIIEAFSLESTLNQKLGKLSGGTKQKVNILLTFMFDSPFLILDEPTTGLDPVSMIQLKKLIQLEKDKGKTILVTTHIMNFAEEIADKVVFLLEGQIYFNGTVGQLKKQTSKDNLEQAIAAILTTEYA